MGYVSMGDRVNINSGQDVNIGGDVIGRDKATQPGQLAEAAGLFLNSFPQFPNFSAL